jgi:hypothetical protein
MEKFATTPDARRQMWKMLLPHNCQSVLEVGANIGLNLEAIGSISDAELYAVEPNDIAREELIASEFVMSAMSGPTTQTRSASRRNSRSGHHVRAIDPHTD